MWQHEEESRLLCRFDQRFQRFHISAIVAGAVDGRFGDEGGVRRPRIVQQPAKRRAADLSFSHVLVAVEL